MDLGIGAMISVAKYISSIPAHILTKFEAEDSIKIFFRYFNDKKYDLAASCLDTAIEKNKSDKELCLMLYTLKGISLYTQGFAINEEIHDRISSGKTDMSGLDPNEYFYKSLVEFDNAKKINAIDPWPWYHKGTIYLVLKQPRDAIQSFENALVLDSVSNELRVSLLELEATAYAMLPEEQDKALECYKKIIELDSSNSNANLMIDFYKNPIKAREEWFGK